MSASVAAPDVPQRRRSASPASSEDEPRQRNEDEEDRLRPVQWLWGSPLVPNIGSTARDYCARERNWLSMVKMTSTLSAVSFALLIRFQFGDRVDMPVYEQQAQEPLGILFFVACLATIVVGTTSFFQISSGYEHRRAFVYAGKIMDLVLIAITVLILASCILLLAAKAADKAALSVSITVVTSLSHLDSLTEDQARVSVIDFHAVWCGPCKAIAPVFQRLASQYGGRVQFLKVDVDAVPDVAQRFQVSAMPTFVVLKGSSKVDEMRGANPAGLMQLVSKHAPTGGAAASTSAPVEKGLEGFTALNSQIDMSQVHCLNEADAHPFKELLRGGGDKWLESDADEQLLLQIPMQQAIKLRALRFTTLPSHAAHAPKTVKLYVNQPATDFDSTTEPAQELVLDEEQAKGLKAVELRFVRFQSVNHLSVFVVDNQGGEDVTRIDKLELIGLDIAGTKMSDLQKQEDE